MMKKMKENQKVISMNRIQKTALWLGCLLLCATVFASAQTISIGLKYGSSAVSEAKLQSDSGFHMKANEELICVLAETTLVVSKNPEGSIDVTDPINQVAVFSYPQSEIPLEFAPADGSTLHINGSEYRGSIRFLYTDRGLTVINYLDLEDYLKGVVAAEMPSSWHIEALKAQAICARNYAMTNKGKFKNYGFDLDDTIQSQVYKGVTGETEATNRAVEETRGLFLTYNGKLASTFFYSSSGGHTESSKFVWGGDLPYLVGVEDPYDTSREWTVPYTPTEIKTKLSGIGVNIGEITDLEVIELSPSGRIIDLKIVGTEGEYHAKLETPRSLFNLRSNLFTITKAGGEGRTVNVLTSTGLEERQISAPILTADGTIPGSSGIPTEYIFNGTGYGHGVGMSQYGAKGMAEKGYTCEQILTHYFTGTSLQTAYQE